MSQSQETVTISVETMDKLHDVLYESFLKKECTRDTTIAKYVFFDIKLAEVLKSSSYDSNYADYLNKKKLELHGNLAKNVKF